MPDLDLSSAVSTDLTNSLVDYSVPTESTDGAQGDVEFEWISEDWNQNLGYYKTIPELKTSIDTKANWVIGAGYEADEETVILLDGMKGNGKDDFNSILKNGFKIADINGDSFSEIIRDEEDILINLKPLDPSSIKIVQNGKGRIIRYEQITKVKKVIKTFKPEEIFHLSRDRVADEIHGISVVKSTEWIILARNEAMADFKRVLHRNVEPLFIFHLDTDDTTKIAEIKTKYDSARKEGENLFVPKGVVEPELVGLAPNSTMNPLTWINQLNDYFFQAVGVPQIIIGNAKEFTDASGKIVYLAFEQSIKAAQLYIEMQALNQLGVEINLTFPASLQTDAVSDTPGEEVELEPQEAAAQPNDTNEELEGKK